MFNQTRRIHSVLCIWILEKTTEVDLTLVLQICPFVFPHNIIAELLQN